MYGRAGRLPRRPPKQWVLRRCRALAGEWYHHNPGGVIECKAPFQLLANKDQRGWSCFTKSRRSISYRYFYTIDRYPLSGAHFPAATRQL